MQQIELTCEIFQHGGKGVQREGGVIDTSCHGETRGEESHGVLKEGGLVQAQLVEQLVTNALVITTKIRFE